MTDIAVYALHRFRCWMVVKYWFGWIMFSQNAEDLQNLNYEADVGQRAEQRNLQEPVMRNDLVLAHVIDPEVSIQV